MIGKKERMNALATENVLNNKRVNRKLYNKHPKITNWNINKRTTVLAYDAEWDEASETKRDRPKQLFVPNKMCQNVSRTLFALFPLSTIFWSRLFIEIFVKYVDITCIEWVAFLVDFLTLNCITSTGQITSEMWQFVCLFRSLHVDLYTRFFSLLVLLLVGWLGWLRVFFFHIYLFVVSK